MLEVENAPSEQGLKEKAFSYDCDITEQYVAYTEHQGNSPSSFFANSGIYDYAIKNGGVCTFKLFGKTVLYQATNEPLVNDHVLAPTTAPIKFLWGSKFMGACPEEDPERRIKRSALLRTLASPQKLNQMKIEVAQFAEEYLKKSLSKELSLEELSLQLVLYIDSHLSGILELKNKPLNHYAETEKYALFMREYIEIAFKAVARKNKLACQQGELAIPFIKDIIKDNFNCIDSSSCDNIIKKIFEIYDMPWTKKAVGQVPVEVLKELSAIIVPLYETTSVSLYWLISYIESNPTIKEKVIIDSIQAIDLDRLSFIDLVVIETIRIAGANPFVVFRDVIKTCDIQIAEKTFRLEEGMQVCLDRRNSNQDQTIFRCPYEFNQDNIVSILQDDHETIHSLFAHKRYEINSFTAVNTFKNPRKCPGRFFSIFIQSCIIREIYSKYTTHVSDVSLDLRKHSLMPRPLAGAKIRIEKR